MGYAITTLIEIKHLVIIGTPLISNNEIQAA